MTTIMKTRRLGNYPRMTQRVMEALLKLREGERSGYPFVALDEFHARTRQTLTRQDYAIASNGYDGVRYKITGRGLKILKVYDTPPKKRMDGLCPQCEERPKAFTKGGRPLGYCKPCYRENAARAYRLIGINFKPDSLCAQCHEKPRYKVNGKCKSAYCEDCRSERDRQRRARKKQEGATYNAA